MTERKIILNPNRADQMQEIDPTTVIEFQTEHGPFHVRISKGAGSLSPTGLIIESPQGVTLVVMSPSGGNQIIVRELDS